MHNWFSTICVMTSCLTASSPSLTNLSYTLIYISLQSENFPSLKLGLLWPCKWKSNCVDHRSLANCTKQVKIRTHTHPFHGPFPGLPRWAGTRPIWILLKQETMSGSGIIWAICKSASRSRQLTTPTPHHSVFYRPGALPATQPTASKHWRHKTSKPHEYKRYII